MTPKTVGKTILDVQKWIQMKCKPTLYIPNAFGCISSLQVSELLYRGCATDLKAVNKFINGEVSLIFFRFYHVYCHPVVSN